MSEKKD
jgi:hypothetical protein